MTRPNFKLRERKSRTPWEAATDTQRERALDRLNICERSDALFIEGGSRAEADKIAATAGRVSVQSVRNWRAAIRSRSSRQSRLEALIDRPRPGRPRREWDAPGNEELWIAWVTDYLRLEAPDATACYRRAQAIAAQRDWDLPPVSAFIARLRREVPSVQRIRARIGAIAAMDVVPYLQRTVKDLEPLDIINGDGRRHDVLVKFPSGRIGRPCVWVWQDIWSRRVLAWRAGETESADLVRTALHEVLTSIGVPGKIITDNTRAVSAKWLTGGQAGRRRWKSTGEELPGLLKLLDIEYAPTLVDSDAAGRGKGRGRSKPVERAFGDLARHIDTHPKLAGAYTGRSARDAPEGHRVKEAAWSDFLEIVGRVVAEHNARSGRRTEMAAGDSFNDAWERGMAGAVIRTITPAQASILLLAAEDALIQPDGSFRLKCGKTSGVPANRYHHPDLLDRAGSRVVARFDPGDLHSAVHAYDSEGRWLCEARCLMPVGFQDQATAKDYERSRRRQRRAAEQALSERRNMDQLVADLDAAPTHAAPAARPAALRLVTGDLPDTPAAPKRATGHRTAALAAAHSLYYKQDEE